MLFGSPGNPRAVRSHGRAKRRRGPEGSDGKAERRAELKTHPFREQRRDRSPE
jgi:hypothetical protein